MKYLVGDLQGLVHLFASIIALITGLSVLVLEKGTKRHKQVGYIYVVSMTLLIITAFLIYRLFNGWGIFHYATVAILVTISLGLIPVWTRKPVNGWQSRHSSFMYWSVVGLYAAFAAEVLTRIPETPFFGMVGIGSGMIMIVGALIFKRNRAKWSKIFKPDRKG